MSIETTYTQARANLATLCDRVAENRESVVIKRRGAESVALISAAELASLTETAHLLRSPRNAERLLKALARAQRETVPPRTLEDLRQEIGVGEEEA